MTEVIWIEKWVNVLVGKPLAWAIYGLWQAGRCLASGTNRCRLWLAQKYLQRGAAGKGGVAAR